MILSISFKNQWTETLKAEHTKLFSVFYLNLKLFLKIATKQDSPITFLSWTTWLQSEFVMRWVSWDLGHWEDGSRKKAPYSQIFGPFSSLACFMRHPISSCLLIMIFPFFPPFPGSVQHSKWFKWVHYRCNWIISYNFDYDL